MAKKGILVFQVIGNLVHNGVEKAKGELIEFEDKLEHNETIQTLLARGMIKPTGDDTEVKTPDPGNPDPAMPPAAVKENDPGSDKVNVVE